MSQSDKQGGEWFTVEQLAKEVELQDGRNPLADVHLTSQSFVALCKLAASALSSCADRQTIVELLDAAKWLRQNDGRKNPHRRGSEAWMDWYSAESEQFDIADAAIEKMEKALALPESGQTMERPQGHDAARERIEACVREIQVIADEFGYDESEWLAEKEPSASSASAESDLVLIWSGEHRAWWRDNGSGYTTVREEAGVYTRFDAVRRTKHCDPGKLIELQPVTALSSSAPITDPLLPGLLEAERILRMIGYDEEDFAMQRLLAHIAPRRVTADQMAAMSAVSATAPAFKCHGEDWNKPRCDKWCGADECTPR